MDDTNNLDDTYNDTSGYMDGDDSMNNSGIGGGNAAYKKKRKVKKNINMRAIEEVGKED
jgi:hypothetical protein